MTMNTGMNIGTVVSKDSLEPLTESILAILRADADQETKRHAIDALARMARVEGVTIQHCVINGDRKVTLNMDDAELETAPRDDSEPA
jgi:hypothetical protein